MSDMRVVHKATLTYAVNAVEMNPDSKIVHVAEQGGDPTIWFERDPNGPVVTRQFLIIGTGLAYWPEGMVHQGTAMCGSLVLHVFERKAVAS